MGYGEYGGGGSVQWRVFHDKKKDDGRRAIPLARQRGGSIDPDGEEGSKFFVVLNKGKVIESNAGRVVVEVEISKRPNDVQVFWGAHVPLHLQRLSDAVAEVEGTPTNAPAEFDGPASAV